MLDADKALFLIERVGSAGAVTAAQVSAVHGWDRTNAHRYLDHLTKEGWLDRLANKRPYRYVLGAKALRLAPDLRL